jgi:glycosyltransferase involved in cell wall biosynthesis
MNPKVSCICPTRGRFETLRECISFFLLQDYNNKELIIFNNHPEPINPHPKLIKHNIKIINAGDHSGKSMEYIYAQTLKHVSEDSEYIAVWDDDDMYFPWHLSSNIKKLTDSGNDAIRARYGYWQDINHSMKDDYTIVSNTLEASMIAKKSCIFFLEDERQKTDPEFTHPHTSWVSKASIENKFIFNDEITANFRWGYGKHYHHLQSVGPHLNNSEIGVGELLRPKAVKHLFYDLLEKVYLTTTENGICCFTNEDKIQLYKKIIDSNIDKFEHIDKFNVWLYWDSDNRPTFIKECHNSIIENTFAKVVVINDKNINEYNLPENILSLHPVQKSDYLRIHLLYHYGGFWFDSDTFVVGDLDEYYFRHLINHESIFPWEYNVPGNMTTPIFSSKGYALIIREALNNINRYLETDPQIGWNGIGVNGILKAVETFKHRGEGYFFGLSDIATFGYNNNQIKNWNFENITSDKLQMIIFHWSQIGAEVSWKINNNPSITNICNEYPNLERLFKLYKEPYL